MPKKRLLEVIMDYIVVSVNPDEAETVLSLIKNASPEEQSAIITIEIPVLEFAKWITQLNAGTN